MAELKMPDLNSVLIAGNLVKDPRLNHTLNETPVSNFTIASNRRFKDNFGEVKEDVCFIGVVAWYKLGEICAENLHKGRAVLVAGELQSRQKRTEESYCGNMVEIKARRVQFLDKQNFQLQKFEPSNGAIKSSYSPVLNEKDEEYENERKYVDSLKAAFSRLFTKMTGSCVALLQRSGKNYQV